MSCIWDDWPFGSASLTEVMNPKYFLNIPPIIVPVKANLGNNDGNLQPPC